MAVNRINEFLEAIKISTDLKTLVETELTYLDCSLSLASKKRALTHYRNAIKRVYGDDHIVLKSLRLSSSENDLFILAGKEQIKKDHTNLKPLDPLPLIETAIDLIKTRSGYSKVAVGLGLLTGRRSTEILKTAIFEIINDSNVVFTGQLKKKEGESKPYPIPVLCDSADIVEALGYIRSLINFDDLTNEAIHSKTNKTLNEQTVKHFGKGFSVHKLRSAYAEICAYWLKEDTQSKANYFGTILGHDPLDLKTAQSYEDFYIDD